MRVFAVLLACAISAASAADASPYAGWKPLAYCNDLQYMNESEITPLTDAQAQRVEELIQVQIVARHGSRAPWAQVFCWDGAGDNPLDANWSCTASSVVSQDLGYKSPTGYGRLYTTSYLDGHNILKGTCVLGGLLPMGRQQHLANGQMLRHAYIGNGPLKLFASDDLDASSGNAIYLRSDDQERTLGSGQALMDGFFPPNETDASVDAMLTWHVADFSIDYVYINEGICPNLADLNRRNMESDEYKQHISSESVQALEKSFGTIVGTFDWDSILECLGVARCNDMPLPNGISEDLFAKVFAEVEERTAIPMLMNESEYSRMAMQPLVAEILETLDAAVNGDAKAPKLAVTMGHDSTLMPLLAAIQRSEWDRKWTPYAGVLVLEVYKTKASSHAVRLLHLGKPMKIPECQDTLCDIAEFQKAVQFARTDRDCVLAASVDDPSSFGFLQYVSTFVLIGLAAIALYLGLRHRRLSKQRQWEDQVELLS